MNNLKEINWDTIHPEIIQTTQAIVEAEKYDDAIFSAFRFIEGEIQERIQSRNIGISLLNEAFDDSSCKIRISKDSRDQKGIKMLFEGALTNMRNDRGHKKAPFLPCTTLKACLQHLSFASLLIYLLDKDINLYPQISSLRVLGSSDQPRAELLGINFSSDSIVYADGNSVQIVRLTPNLLEVALSANFSGNLQIHTGDQVSNVTYCDTSLLNQRSENRYEIISSEIPLYSDANCSQKRENVVGLLLNVSEAGHDSLRITPTHRNIFKAGYYVTHGPFLQESVGESWYKEPSSGEIKYAWTGSLISNPTIICPVTTWKLGGIELLPKKVKTEPGEARTMTVIGWEIDGEVSRKINLTSRVKWNSSDKDVIFVKSGIAYSKNFGKATLNCVFENFHASSEAQVAHFSKGEKTVFHHEFSRLQKIRFDTSDNLYICNQSDAVYRLNAAGGLDKTISIASLGDHPAGIDCIAVDKDKNLYTNNIVHRNCLKFPWNGKSYGRPIELGSSTQRGTKKSIAIADSGDVFIAEMGSASKGGRILCVNPNGAETYFKTHFSPINVALDPNGNICIPHSQEKSIIAYDRSGNIIKSINYNFAGAATDIFIDKNGAFYLPMFHEGILLKVIQENNKTKTEVIATGFQNPSGVTMDSKGRIFISNFTGDNSTIDIIYS